MTDTHIQGSTRPALKLDDIVSLPTIIAGIAAVLLVVAGTALQHTGVVLAATVLVALAAASFVADSVRVARWSAPTATE